MSWSGKQRRKVVSLVGLPGSGKTTLSRALAERLGWCALIVGDLLRERAKADQRLADDLGRGDLAPEELVEEIIRGEVSIGDEEGLVLDGFPRHTKQAAIATQLFPEWKVIYLDVPETIARTRLTTRGHCQKCGFIGSIQKGSCPMCGSRTWSSRMEDRSDAIDHRLALALPALEGVLKAIPKSSIFSLDASLPTEELTTWAVAELLKSRMT